MNAPLVAVLAYLLALAAFGAWRSRGVRDDTDFIVAGRRLGPGVLAGTLLATWIGSGSLIAGAGLAYEHGFGALWMAAGDWIGIAVVVWLAPRYRSLARMTVPEILEDRYGPAARILGMLTVMVAYTAIVSYQLRAGGYVLNVVADIPVERGVALTCAFVVLYTAMSGMVSVAYTDVVNGVVMIFGLLAGLPLLVAGLGGFEGMASALPRPHLTPLGGLSAGAALALFLPTLMLVMGDSAIAQRLFSARDPQAARRAARWWIGGTIVVEIGIVALAMAGAARFPGIDPETVILHIARHGLPPVIGIALLGAGVAIIVSTADSYLLVTATSAVRDVYVRFIRPDASPSRVLALARILVVFLGVAAYLQLHYFETVLGMAIYAYTVYGAGITPALLAALLWRRATAAGGVASIAGGMVGTVGWTMAGTPGGIDAIFPAAALSIGLLVGVSLAGARPPDNPVTSATIH